MTVRNGKAPSKLPLPAGGLMSLNSHAKTAQEILKLKKILGCRLGEPFLQMAFLQLPVIAYLKLTDLGLVDVDHFELLE